MSYALIPFELACHESSVKMHLFRIFHVLSRTRQIFTVLLRFDTLFFLSKSSM